LASSQDQVTASADTTVAATAAAVHAERIRTLYRQSAGILLVSPLNAAVVALVLWPTASSGPLAGWVVATAAVTALRALHRRQYLRALPTASETDFWAQRLVIGAVLTGVLWGLAVVLFYDTRALGTQLLLIFVVAGMIAGASGTLALHLPAFLGFTAAAVVPTAARLIAEGDPQHTALGGLAIVFGAAMSLIASNTNRAVTESFRLRFEKQHLLARLSDAQVSLAEANRTLERRVAERGAALERQTEALRDAQRMESVGLLAGGIAHDFNNLLTVVMGNVSLLLGEPSLDTGKRERLDEIHRAAARGANLVSQLLAFSRRQVMVRKVIDLNRIVAELQPLLGRLIGEHVQLVVAASGESLPVRADPTQLQQVIINLATNARDAMDAGGTLTIEAALVDGTPPGTAIPPGRYVVLSVRDTGVGMEPDTRRMAFHPFFTTKEVGRGTGLGLATVYGIVEQTGGHVSVESEPGCGSCFRIFLPWTATENGDMTVAPPELRPDPIPHATTLLIAEDDTMVRAVTARVLGAAGYTVIEAADGEQALDIIRGHAGLIDLLVSDIVMPNLGGVELAKRVLVERPEILILLVTGYDPEGMSILDDKARPVGFLQKPFTPTQLLAKVSTMLAARSSDYASL
jgi:signal transduction histidine kinase/CheY-like chemotaxis protein